jgi:hypothetical protein
MLSVHRSFRHHRLCLAAAISSALAMPGCVAPSADQESAPADEPTAATAEALSATRWGSNAGYYDTIRFPDLDGDGKPDVCGRGIQGILCARSTGAAFGTPSLWNASFSDANGWLDAKYWSTLAYVDVNGDHMADVCGRGADGIYCALSTGTAFGSATQWTTYFNDHDGWGQGPAYYGTIQFVDLNHDGKADVCGRGAAGVYCSFSTGSGFTVPTLWNGSFSDAGGWAASAAFYGTIQFPDVNGDGKPDVCGRGHAGMYCGLSTGSAFAAVTLTDYRFSDSLGWNNTVYASTIRYAVLEGTGRPEADGRGSDGVLSPSGVNNEEYADFNGWNTSASHYGTIRFPDLDGDGLADVCGRGTNGLWCQRNLSGSFAHGSWWNSDVSDANGWLNARYYETIQYPDLNHDGKQDLCARGAAGVYCATSTGSAFGPLSLWSSYFSD